MSQNYIPSCFVVCVVKANTYELLQIPIKYYNFQFLGPQLPFKVRDFAMTPTPSGKGVILIGGYDDTHRRSSNLILELNGETLNSLSWNIMEHKLKFQRSYHTAVLVPDDLTTQKSSFVREPTPIRDFSGGSIYRMEAPDPHRICYDPRYGQDTRQNPAPHLTQYCSSRLKFPIYAKSRVARSWKS